MRSRWLSRWAIAPAIAALVLIGCGDTNLFDGQADSSGDQAQLEAGRAALDSGNWTEAQAIFLAMDTSDPEVQKYLASAYVGEAGFNMLELVEMVDTAQAAGAADDAIYDSITSIFDDGTGIMAPDVLATRTTLVLNALEALGAYDLAAPRVAGAAATPDGISGDNVFQSGVYAALHATLMVVGELVSQDPSHPEGTLILTLDELRRQEPMYGIIALVGLTPEELEDFNGDLGLVRDAVVAIDPEYLGGQFDNDIAEELDKFLTAIGYLDGSGAVDGVDNGELRAYLTSLL